MKAMVLKNICNFRENKEPLEMVNLPDPIPGEREILVKVSACGVCHTELDEIEGRTPPPRLPVVLGHQVVGKVEKVGSGANNIQLETGSVLPGFIRPAVSAIFVFKGMKTCVKNLRPPVRTLTADMPNT